MKRIILLEDNVYEAEDIINDIRLTFRDQYPQLDIEWAPNIYKIDDILFADDSIKEKYNNCCLIIDLNLPPDNLRSIVPISDNRYTGWYWIKEHSHAFTDSVKIIIHSAFSGYFLKDHKLDIEEFPHQRQLVVIEKTITSEGNTILLNEVRKYLEQDA